MSQQARYWLGTLYDWTVPNNLPEGVDWIKGQQETCPTTGRLHHQIIVGFKRAVRLAAVRRAIGTGHFEITRSNAADAYVWKEDTRVPNTQFELGNKPIRRNNGNDWDRTKQLAKDGKLDEIPADIYVRYYRTLKTIAADCMEVPAIVRSVTVFWGKSGTGKRFYLFNFSKRAWEEAGLQAYSKDPRTKWWCGYSGQENVIIDEFRGTVDISHILRWLDRYPVRVESKGSSQPLLCKRLWITSNLAPEQWYPDLDPATLEALLRRLTNIIEFN